MRRIVIAFATLLAVCGIATAETYPSRRITVIVPFGAGSGTDGVARIVTQRLAEKLKTIIVVENRPGASGAIGAVAAARSAPDGYTLFFGGASTHAANPSLLKSIQYSPREDFAPIASLGLFPYILVINPEIQANNVGELIALAKQKPGSLSFAYGNALGRLSGEMLKRRAGIDLQAVPYKSSPEGITDVVAGRVSMMFGDMTAALPRRGRVSFALSRQSRRIAARCFPSFPQCRNRGSTSVTSPPGPACSLPATLRRRWSKNYRNHCVKSWPNRQSGSVSPKLDSRRSGRLPMNSPNASPPTSNFGQR